jgi:glycosyltransferase involved in cell wall biosynthesis
MSEQVEPQTGAAEDDGTDISVIVPFYNAERHIERCVTALLTQNYPPERYEIIMVDNNSTDQSAALVATYPRVRLISEPKRGAYAARNRGVGTAKGRILAFTDADCVPARDWLEEIVRSLTSPGVALVQGRRFYGNNSPAMAMLAAYESERAAFTFSSKSRGLYYGYTNNMAVRRDVFDRSGPFLEVMRGADSIFVHRVVEDYSCDAIVYAGDARIRHLELTSVRGYLHKRFLYGKSLQLNYERRKSAHRPITFAERFEVIRRTVRREGCSVPGSLRLVVLVVAGMLCFTAGRLYIKLGDIVRSPGERSG